MHRFVTFVCLFLLVAPSGCEHLELPTTDTEEPPAAEIVSVPPKIEQPAPVPQTPEQVIAGVLAKSGMEITDSDLTQLASLETGRETITELNLTAATISSESFKAMASFPALTNLCLESTRLTDTGWEELAKVKSLQTLNLNRSAINNSLMVHIAELPHLQRLELGQTVVTDDGLMALSKQSELTEINVGGTEVTGTGFAALGTKGARAPIRIVRAPQSLIGYQGFVYFKEFPELEEVQAAGASVTDGSMEGLKRNANLRILNVSGGMVSDVGIRNLVAAKGLEELDLSNNRAVTDASLKRLQRYSKLRKLNIEKTSCTLKGVESLKKALPDCQVQFQGQTF